MSKIIGLRKNIFAVYVLAVIFASAIVNLLLKMNVNMDYLSLDIYRINAVYKENILSVFFYIFMKRAKQMLIIYLLSRVINPDILQNMIIIILVFLFGVFLSVQTYYYGFTGIIILMASIFPQYIVYIILIKYLCQSTLKEKNNRNRFVYYINVTLLLLAGVVFEEIFLIFFLSELQQYIVLGI